jgi:hypothetical protein
MWITLINKNFGDTGKFAAHIHTDLYMDLLIVRGAILSFPDQALVGMPHTPGFVTNGERGRIASEPLRTAPR